MNLSELDFRPLTYIKRGIEREALRVTLKGNVAQSPHSKHLGEKLTHPNITVDYSEGLLELITEPFEGYTPLFNSLDSYLNFTYQNLENHELLWPMSMPPTSTEAEIQIAEFGHSNSGMMKHIYRKGLAVRYGKIMQIIAGIHYNFSFPDEFLMQLISNSDTQEHSIAYYKNKYYFRLIRKFYQNAWILLYLFGATPLIAKTSVKDKHQLNVFDSDYYYHEHATCLRMSEFGYQSQAQKDLHISYRDITSYVSDLIKATQIPYSKYTQLGVLDKEYGYKQLNDCILQIENEYYNPIRPKQIVHRCERPACALSKRGVSYIELRTLDINPFIAQGLDIQSAKFLDVFFLYCLLAEAPMYSKSMIQTAKANFALVANYGRNPNLKLYKNKEILLNDWAEIILDECLSIAQKWDETNKSNDYTLAVNAQIEKLTNKDKTPSAMLINSIKQSGLNSAQWMLTKAYEHQKSTLATNLTASELTKLKREVIDSQEALKLLEAKEEGAYESYIQRYYASVCR
ncbi:glutamate--cysteine ligase [Thiotrichales bacterium 19S3-7]|nr:glutamate--cysteine ligase [Thiotrichales bacterium 19S3-7]MCF6800940.1 glutamate--cysteine ligase [Thiotrichales bacterium 19S3-11]